MSQSQQHQPPNVLRDNPLPCQTIWNSTHLNNHAVLFFTCIPSVLIFSEPTIMKYLGINIFIELKNLVRHLSFSLLPKMPIGVQKLKFQPERHFQSCNAPKE